MLLSIAFMVPLVPTPTKFGVSIVPWGVWIIPTLAFDFLDLYKAWKQLTKKEKDILHYRFWDKLTYQQIAIIYKMERPTITECYYKPAICKLRKFLEDVRV